MNEIEIEVHSMKNIVCHNILPFSELCIFTTAYKYNIKWLLQQNNSEIFANC